MKLAEAADVFLEEDRRYREAKARRDVAADMLKDHFRKTGRRTYKGKIAYSVGTQTRLDTAKVKVELYERLDEFQKTVTVETVSALG